MPLTWLQAGEKYRYREWLVDQEGDEIKTIGCYKVTSTYRSRPALGEAASSIRVAQHKRA
jgi:hypothetical protein